MSALGSVLAELVTRLTREGVPYMVIGGVANIHWGRNRLTQDVDVTVRVADEQLPGLLAALAPEFVPRPSDPLAFARELSIVPLVSRSGVRVDLVLGRIRAEFAAIDRAVVVPVEGVAARFISAEDLIVQKIVSDRPRDREDVVEIVRRQSARLDRDWLRARVAELAGALELPTLSTELDRLLTDADASLGGPPFGEP